MPMHNQTNIMKTYRRPQQYIYHPCQPGRVARGLGLLVSVCILMLPMLVLVDEHVQLTTMYHMNPINQWNGHPCYDHMISCHTSLALPPLNNVIPAMALQSRVVKLNIGCASYSSSHSGVRHIPPILDLDLPSGLVRRVVGVVLVLLLLLSGDIETNPGPIGQLLTVDDLRVLTKELNDVRAKWYDIGVQLGVSVGTLKATEKQYLNNPTDCLREALTTLLISSTPTWTKIVDALNVVGEVRLAADLEHRYCLTQDPAQPSTSQPPESEALPSVTTPQNPEQPSVAAGMSGIEFQEYLVSVPIAERIRTMEIKFVQLVDKVQEEHNIPLQRLKRCITLLPASTKDQHIAFIRENLSEIKESKCMEDIFLLLNLYWDFLNYTLLEHIVSEFGNNDTKAAMAKYVCELVAFRRATKLSEFISHWPCTGKVPPDMSRLVIKMDRDWSNCTLEDVEQFRRTLTQKLLLPSFTVLLRDAEQGCISLTWLIPSSIVKILSKDIHNTKLDWFKEHHIERLAIDGQDLYSSATFQYSTFLKKLYTSQNPLPTLSSSPLPQKLLPFKLARIEKEKVSANEFTKRYLRGDMDDVGSLDTNFYKKSPIEFEDVGEHSSHHQHKLILIEGAPGVGKTTFSWEFCRKWSRGEILQGHSLLLLLPMRDNSLKAAKTLTDLFYHPYSELQQAVVQEVTSNQGKGVVVWLEAWDELDDEPREKASVFLDLIHGRILPLATVFVTSRPWASEHLRENYEDRITQHVEILTSAKDQIEFYISKAEAEAQPSSFAAKFIDYLSSNPVIRAAMYTPVTAKMAGEVFTWTQHTQSLPPTTLTELFTTFTLKTLVDHLSTHPVYHKQQLKITTFSDLPTDVHKQFQDLCRLAYQGILNRQQLVFSAAHLPTGFAPLGLMQEVPQLYTEGRASSYHFIHLTLQEYLAAVHISRFLAPDQTRVFQEHLHSGYFKMTMRLLAGLTKLAAVPPDISRMADTKLTYFHFLSEAKVTTGSFSLDMMVVEPHYSWTPLDYYVTGYAISHSNCSWRLNFRYSSIDDEKFELFCQGCAAPGGTGCRGHISYADFSINEITSESIQSIVNIPIHILQDMRGLYLHNNKLDESACDLVAKAVLSMPRLEKLWLGGNPLGSGGAVEVIKALRGSGVKELLLDNTGIGEPDCEALCELLKSTYSLENLFIEGNNLSSESVASIITGLNRNSSRVILRISNSHFSMANVENLASVLRDQLECIFTQLKLRYCHISGQGACELAGALCKNSILTFLDLNCNPIGVEGASSMSDMLQHNTSLEWLGLGDDSVGEEGVHQLINSLKHNQTLRRLELPSKYKTETSDHRIYWVSASKVQDIYVV